jgi:hypothetical protein
VFLVFFSVFRSKPLNILSNQAKRALFDIYSLFKDFKMLGGAPESVSEPRYPLLPPLLSIFRPKTTANPPIDNVKDKKIRNSSPNLGFIKIKILLKIALNYPHRIRLL